MMDVDGDGQFTLATDGLIISRALAGLSGTAVIQNSLGAGATRTTWQAIRFYLETNCRVLGLAP